jgi:prepilin signal peptidase PulO-like enzyme (type II secretory pathway)
LEVRDRLTVVFIYFTIVLFVASLAAHVSLYVGFNVQARFPTLWFVLNVSILVGFIPLGVRYLSNHFSDVTMPAPKPYVPGSAPYVGAPHVAEAIVGAAMGFILFYPFFNLIYCEEMLHGYPEIIDGRYFMHYYHGGGLHQISPDVFAVKSLYQARKLSGHWMAAHLIAFLLLMHNLKEAPDGSFFQRFKSRCD